MSDKILSAKRQVVLPAELCRQMALVPGAAVQVSMAPDGSGILIRPAAGAPHKPASVLFGRHAHKGPPVSIADMQGVALARRAGKAGAP
jgi:bifunctional DNA-binding transcriptional regulator/antitoxin component of YhaV-PrlF toxin-antitoxin module